MADSNRCQAVGHVGENQEIIQYNTMLRNISSKIAGHFKLNLLEL